MGGPRAEYLRPERRSEQGQIADQVEGLVPAGFVVEPQRLGAHDPVLADHHPVLHAEQVFQLVQFFVGQVHVRDDHRAFQAAPLDQSPFAQGLHVTQEGPRPRRGELGDELVLKRIEHGVLAGQVGFLVVDHVGQMEIVGGHDDEFLQQAVLPFRIQHGVVQFQVFPGSVLFDDARFDQRVHEGNGAAVADRRLVPVEFDPDIVQAQARDGGQDVLHGVNPDAVPREVRPPGRIDHVVYVRRDFQIVGMVDTHEPDPDVHGTRLERYRCPPPGMQADALDGRRGLYRMLAFEHVPLLFSFVG